MNRRDFIKASIPAIALPATTITCKYEDDEKGPEKESSRKYWRWEYVVYLYEREQGEWLFDKNAKGCFAPQREYMSFDEEDDLTWNPHGVGGWMDGGKLHFTSINEAIDFIEMHVRCKPDINIEDSIYDIYYLDLDNLDYYSCRPAEIHVGHFWYNGDTGREISWTRAKPYTDFNKVESA